MDKPNLLVIDDEVELLNCISDLAQHDFNVTEAENGKEALKILKTQKIDLILTDYNMPHMDGLELIKNLYEMHSKVPVIVLTGQGNRDVQCRSLAYNIFEYVEKPFRAPFLLEVLKRGYRHADIANIFTADPNQLPRPNVFAQAYYCDLTLKISKDSLTWIQTQIDEQGLSMGTFIEDLIEESRKRKAG